ncbi:hypothetical protein ACFL6S_23695 [Candidatus Poribacteria bacterium]
MKSSWFVISFFVLSTWITVFCESTKGVLPSILCLSLAGSLFAGVICAHAQEPLKQDDFFPIVLYTHWHATTLERMLEVMDDAQEHGFNTVNAGGTSEEVKTIQAYAQKKGMAISSFCDSKINLSDKMLKYCVYSPEYEANQHKFLKLKRAHYESLPRFWATDIRDEWCVQARFACHCEYCRRLFKAKYGFELPEKMPSMTQPVLRRRYVEFYNDYWAKVWKLTADYMRANNPNFLMSNTYTENICLGRHLDLVFGDLLKWSEPLDWIAADIYPYYYGRHENDIETIEWDIKRSRLLMAFLRCAGKHHGIPFAWWVGCTSSTEETPKAIRHISYTAIGQGAAGFIGWGAYFPEVRPVLEYNPELWEDAGKTFRDISKIGPLLRHLKKTSRIALLVSETEALFATPKQYAGPFYCDSVPAYDALLKAFGNADLIYERQIAAGKLNDYEALVMANTRHIADDGAKGIEEFVSGGGVLMSDTVPELNEDNKPSKTLTKVLGRSERKRLGHGHPDAFPSVFTSDYGQGKVLLLRFRMGSFYRVPALWGLIRSRLQTSGVHPLAVSSNPDIESNYLAGKECFVVIAVNRSRAFGRAEITCFRPPFAPKHVRDLIGDEELPFSWSKKDGQDALSITLDVEGISGRVIGVYP